MCKLLSISRSSYYYQHKDKSDEKLINLIIKIFNESRCNYGSRKIKIEIDKLGYAVSIRKIRKIMKAYNLNSNYTIKKFKITNNNYNKEDNANKLNSNFDVKEKFTILSSDLTYVKINGSWKYICLIIDLFNREVVSYSISNNKTSQLVKEAILKIEDKLGNVEIFHTDRGLEFKNQEIEKIFKKYQIYHSLSKPGCPYDNAVSETTYNIFKREFLKLHKFKTLEELDYKLFDYINWFNNFRIHSTLGYLSPVEFKKINSK